MGKIYTYDIGTRLRMTLSSDLAGYSTAKFSIEKPDETTLLKTCTVEDESNGIIYYDTIEDDFDEAGFYHIQAQIVFASGSQFESETQTFRVFDSFT